MRSFLLLLGTLGLSACSSAPIEIADLNGPTLTFDGFPAQAFEGIVYAQASFDSGYGETFDTDLIRRGIVPLHLTVQLRGEGQDNAQILIKPGRMGARLYLLDGTALRHVPSDQVAASLGGSSATRVRTHAFQGGLLSAAPSEGYLYFSLAPSEAFETDGRELVHTHLGIRRTLDLADSLIIFDVMVNNTPRPLYVGIQR